MKVLSLPKTDPPSLVKFETATLFIICFPLKPPLHCTEGIYYLRTEAQKKKKGICPERKYKEGRNWQSSAE